MRYFSMFSGIGGFELGIQRAFSSTQGQGQPTETSAGITQGQGEQLPKQRIQGLACIGYSEIDKYAIKVYERNFNGDNRPDLRNGVEEIQEDSTNTKKRKDRTTRGHINYGDATAINSTELPDFDLLVGGFPCQAFSVAGKRKGFDDTRGTLFFDIARILAEKRPRHLVLENVKGLLSHDSGKTFQTILGVLSDLGYRVEWQVLNSKDFGVPQNRERIYIVGHLRGECGGKVFPITGADKEDIGQTKELREQVSNTLRTNYGGATSNETYIAENLDLDNDIGYNGLQDANAKKTRPNQPLSCLRKTDEKSGNGERKITVDTPLQETEVLQSEVYGKRVRGQLQNGQSKLDDLSLQGKTDIQALPQESMRNMQEEYSNRNTPQERGLARQQAGESTRTLSGLSHEDAPNRSSKERLQGTLKEQLGSIRIRRLTPVETERLQGFPDDWTKTGFEWSTARVYGDAEFTKTGATLTHQPEQDFEFYEEVDISDTQRYKMCGNAVTVNVVQAVMERLIPCLK